MNTELLSTLNTEFLITKKVICVEISLEARSTVLKNEETLFLFNVEFLI